ncbi:MAG: ATP-binding protein [Gammaproteobacteria bacterium]
MSKADRFFRRAERLLKRIEDMLPSERDTANLEEGVAWRWRTGGGNARLEPITRFNQITLEDLLHVERQKDALVRNTEQFLAGVPANNALLWGPRGTGKSSLVKALLNDFSAQGLRLIEVDRLDLVDLPEIIDHIEYSERRYVIYCDDLSFDENDATYRALKTVLDGSVLETPDNIVIYATSNRRHLVPERQSDNADTRVGDGELHHGEAVEEKISLSERFGLWLSFHPLNQERYLDIVEHWLKSLGTSQKDQESMRKAALEWALLHGSRSGRTAYQFARDWTGREALAAK